MQSLLSPTRRRLFTLLTCVLILKITISVLLTYHNYFPPNFEAVFLQGRKSYFYGAYSWAFYAHILSGPCALILGMIQLSERFRLRFTNWHRYLGRIQVVCVLLLVSPSGLWMARYAETGAVAGAGFATLAIATGLCVALGWRSAMQRRFSEHRLWMWRCYILLCSAVLIRVQGGLFTVMNIDAEWLYPQAAWTSWLAPLLLFELYQVSQRNQPQSLPNLTARRVG